MNQRHFTYRAFFLLLISFFYGCTEETGLTTQSLEARAAYNEGMKHWENFYYTEAKSSFESTVTHDSSFAMAWARLAMVNFSTQNDRFAKAEIERAMRLSVSATRKEQLFIRMWERRIEFAMDEAAVIADSLIALYPKEPEPYVFRGGLFEQNKNLDAAIKSYQKAVEVDTGYAPAVMQLGYAYSTANEQEKAIATMERYIRLVPGAADPRASYADLLLRVGRYDEALEQYRQSLELKPDYWYSLQQIGTIYSIQGKLDAAVLQFEAGFNVLPQSEQLAASRKAVSAGLEMQRMRYQEAVTLYDEALALDSANFTARFGLVNALGKLHKFNQARGVVEEIREELTRKNLDETGSMQGFHTMKARLFLEEGLLEEAKAECEKALQFSSPLSRPSVIRWLAEIHVHEKQYEAALDACEIALSVNPNSPLALLTLTRVYAALGDERMTREISNRLLALWKHADNDFVELISLKKILGSRGAGQDRL
ncbi:MAG: tetratricopeptide repeat protein [Bacteroidota bacterium]